MAERYRDLVRPALIDVGARSTPSGGEEAAMAIAQSLASFSRTANAITGPLIAAGLTKSGSEAGAEAGRVGTPEMKSMWNAYGRAYNNAALRSYTIRQEADMDEQAARLEVEAGTDPKAFQDAMAEIQKNVLAEAPPEARAAIAEAYTKRTGDGLARIQVALGNELRAEDKMLVDDQVSRMTEKIAFLRSQDTPEAYAAATEEEGKLALLLDSAVTDRTYSEVEGRIARTETARKIVFETVRSKFVNEMNSPYGDPIGFIEDLKEANRTANTLPPDQEAALENALLAELRDRNALRNAQQSEEAAAIKARYDAGDRFATAKLLAGELSQRDLLQMISDDQVTPAIARTLLNELQSSATKPAKSDPKTLFRFKTNLLQLTEEDILTEPGLTWEDRSALLLQRREEEAGWKGTQVAKEGFDRIDRAIGIVPGTPVKMLSEEELRARDAAFTDLYDRIEALPPEERQAAILPMSREVIRVSITERAEREIQIAQKTLDDMQQQLQREDLSDRERRILDERMKSLSERIRQLEQTRQN